MKKYKHLLFDLDHTLWDYDANAKETLLDMYDQHGLGSYGYFTELELVEVFMEINQKLWTQYNHGITTKNYIRQQRFALVFNQLGLPEKYFPQHFDRDFTQTCPLKTNTIPHAVEVLDYLQPRYPMHIITNGFNDVQSIKLEKSGLGKYFDKVVTSESCGAKKPSKQIFEYTLKKILACTDECVMIGDNLKADILGAKNASIDQVFFNPEGIAHNEEITIEIRSLKELKDHF